MIFIELRLLFLDFQLQCSHLFLQCFGLFIWSRHIIWNRHNSYIVFRFARGVRKNSTLRRPVLWELLFSCCSLSRSISSYLISAICVILILLVHQIFIFIDRQGVYHFHRAILWFHGLVLLPNFWFSVWRVIKPGLKLFAQMAFVPCNFSLFQYGMRRYNTIVYITYMSSPVISFNFLRRFSFIFAKKTIFI